jgi:hypothetical protein
VSESSFSSHVDERTSASEWPSRGFYGDDNPDKGVCYRIGWIRMNARPASRPEGQGFDGRKASAQCRFGAIQQSVLESAVFWEISRELLAWTGPTADAA